MTVLMYFTQRMDAQMLFGKSFSVPGFNIDVFCRLVLEWAVGMN